MFDANEEMCVNHSDRPAVKMIKLYSDDDDNVGLCSECLDDYDDPNKKHVSGYCDYCGEFSGNLIEYLDGNPDMLAESNNICIKCYEQENS